MKKTIQLISAVENLGRLTEFIPGVRFNASAEEDFSFIKINCSSEKEIIILDLRCAVGSAMNFLQNVKYNGSTATVIVLTSMNNDDFRNRCFRLGADYFFDKEKDIKELSDVLNSLIKKEAEIAEFI